MFKVDIKIFAKNEKEFETIIETVRIYNLDIGMEFGKEKCSMLMMRSGNLQMTEGMLMLTLVFCFFSRKNQNVGEKEIYKYLVILEADIIKQVEMKEKN